MSKHVATLYKTKCIVLVIKHLCLAVLFGYITDLTQHKHKSSIGAVETAFKYVTCFIRICHSKC